MDTNDFVKVEETRTIRGIQAPVGSWYANKHSLFNAPVSVYNTLNKWGNMQNQAIETEQARACLEAKLTAETTRDDGPCADKEYLHDYFAEKVMGNDRQ